MALEKIDIIIPTRNHNSDLFECLNSLNKNINPKSYNVEIIIVDDFSSKESRQELLEKISEYENLAIYPIFLNKHYDLSVACNSGLNYSLNKKFKPKYIGFLHDDVIIFKNWIENLISVFKFDDSIYGVGSITANNLDDQCISKHYKKINSSLNIENYFITPNEYMEEVSSKYFSNNDLIVFDQVNNEGKISLFSSIFRIEAFNKNDYNNINENLISSIGVDIDVSNKIISNHKKVALNLNSFVAHQCRLLQNSNPSLDNFKKLSEISKLIRDLSINFNNNGVNYDKQYVVYTYVHEYGSLPNITKFDPQTSYICFTNDNNTYVNRNKSYPWEIIYVQPIIDALELPDFDIRIKQFFMLHPHLFFKNYSTSIWIDSSNVSDFSDQTEEIVNLIDKKYFLLATNSTLNDCAYVKLISLFKNEQMPSDKFDAILQLFRWYRFPKNLGLIDTSILIRKHNVQECVLTMNKIWFYVKKYHVTETLFFNLCLWLFKYGYSYIPNTLFFNKYAKLLKD